MSRTREKETEHWTTKLEALDADNERLRGALEEQHRFLVLRYGHKDPKMGKGAQMLERLERALRPKEDR